MKKVDNLSKIFCGSGVFEVFDRMTYCIKFEI